jgi:hypothetical protein
MDEVIVDNYEDWECLIQQNIASHWGYTGEKPCIITLERRIYNPLYSYGLPQFFWRELK